MVSFPELAGRRVLVTGSTGFKGSWLCSWLLMHGAEVSGYALPPEPDAPLFAQLRLEDRIRQTYADIRDLTALRRTFEAVRPEVVIHLAAQALVFRSYNDPKTTFDVNVGGATNLLEVVRSTDDIRALVFITSDKCYRNKEWIWGYRENDDLGGDDPYSASKAAAELVFAAYHHSFLSDRPSLHAVTARAGNVVGGGDLSDNRIVPDCIRALRAGQPIILRRPHSTRPWQHVLEPLSGYLALACGALRSDPVIAGPWNFGPDAHNVRTVEELARGVIDTWGSGKLMIEPQSSTVHEARLLMLNNDKAKTILKWFPRWSFEQTVKQTVDWYKSVDQGEDPREVTARQIGLYEQALSRD